MTAIHIQNEGEIARSGLIAVRAALCIATVLSGGVARAQERDGRCPTPAADWAERCRGTDAVRIVLVTCLAGRVVFDVTETGDRPLRIDVLRAASGGVLRAGGAGISPVGDFPDWPAESAGHHAALQRIASCLWRDASVLDVGVGASNLGPHPNSDERPAERRAEQRPAEQRPSEQRPAEQRRSVSASTLAVGTVGAVVACALMLALYRRVRTEQTPTVRTATNAVSRARPGNGELVAAAATMGVVVGVIDAAGVGELRLALALGPFACVVAAAFTTVTVRQVVAWLVTFGAVAAILRDASYAALAYPAIAIGAARLVRRLGQPRR
jgi:hypothetical protein